MESLVSWDKRHFLKTSCLALFFWILKYLCIFWSLCTASGHSEAAAVFSGLGKGSLPLQQQRHQISVLEIMPAWLCVQECSYLHKIPIQPVQHFFFCSISFPVCFMTSSMLAQVVEKLWSSISEFLVFAETIASPYLLTFLVAVF